MSIGESPYLHVNIDILRALLSCRATPAQNRAVSRAIERKERSEIKRKAKLRETQILAHYRLHPERPVQ
jgi:hypothetical protein